MPHFFVMKGPNFRIHTIHQWVEHSNRQSTVEQMLEKYHFFQSHSQIYFSFRLHSTRISFLPLFFQSGYAYFTLSEQKSSFFGKICVKPYGAEIKATYLFVPFNHEQKLRLTYADHI